MTDIDNTENVELDPLFHGVEVDEHTTPDNDDSIHRAEATVFESPGPLSASVTGLSTKHRIAARDAAVRAAFLGYNHRSSIHYTQGPRRWEGINKKIYSSKGDYPHYADCSAFATWCLYQGLRHYDVRDVVNGAAWRAGYTGTMLNHGKQVIHEKNLQRGDLVIYGNGFPGEHVAIYVGGGKVVSHGSEAGPFFLPVHYRGDVMQFRRYI